MQIFCVFKWLIFFGPFCTAAYKFNLSAWFLGQQLTASPERLVPGNGGAGEWWQYSLALEGLKVLFEYSINRYLHNLYLKEARIINPILQGWKQKHWDQPLGGKFRYSHLSCARMPASACELTIITIPCAIHAFALANWASGQVYTWWDAQLI